MLSHIVSDLHEVYVNEVIKPQIGTDNGPKKESSAALKAGEGAEASAKRIRQATYDIRSKAKKSGEDLETIYRQYMGQSSMPGDEKNSVKEKLGLTDTTSSVKEETENKKFQVRVKDKDTGKTYVRNATREKINQLRGNPNISSVEMTKYGKPSKNEASQGKHTASVKSGKGLDQDGDGDNDFADIMSARMQASGMPRDAANKKVSDKPYNKKSSEKSVKEEFSNWRDELYEITGEIEKKKKDEKISERKNVANKVIINPPLKETVENMGGQLVEFFETEDNSSYGILDEMHDAELYFINENLIENVVTEIFEECLNEGYEFDYILDTILESIDESLQVICEAEVTYGHDTEGDAKVNRRKSVLNKIGKVAKKVAYSAGKFAGKVVKGAKKATALAKRGYESEIGSKSSPTSTSDTNSSGRSRSSENTENKKEGTLSRIGKSLKSGIKKVIARGARSVARGARNVARKVSESYVELQELDTWSPEKTADTGDVDAKIKARKKSVEVKKKTTSAAPLSYLPPASALAALTAKKKEQQNEERIQERALDTAEKGEKERLVKGMKKSAADFKKRYGARAKSVMYATATKQAKHNMDTSKSDRRYSVEEVSIDEAIVDLPTKSDDSLRSTQQNTVRNQQNQQRQNLQQQKQQQKTNPQDRKLANIQKMQLSAKMKQVNQGIPLKDSYEIEEAISGLRPASERVKNAITPAQRKRQEQERKRQQELKDKAELALAGMKKTAKPGAVTQTKSKSAAPEANRSLKSGKKVDTLAVKANKVISSSYEMEGDSIEELNRYEKETGKDYKTGKSTSKGGTMGGDDTNSKVMRHMHKIMGAGRMGAGGAIQPRGEKKERGKKPPKAGEYGGPITPAQKVAKRRAAAQRSQDSMSSRFD